MADQWFINLQSDINTSNSEGNIADQWIINLQSEINTFNFEGLQEKQKKHCIFRVPKKLRELNKEAYTPEVVSLGPYHHGDEHLKPMEEYKRLALWKYLSLTGKTLEEVAVILKPELRDFMEAYDELDQSWMQNEDRFLELMILDGCFVCMLNSKLIKLPKPYMHAAAVNDMLKLENQLPLRVIDILTYKVTGIKFENDHNFRGVADDIDTLGAEKAQGFRGMGRHTLDFARKNFACKGDYYYDSYIEWIVRPATELFQSGVDFQPAMGEISFSNGVLKLPLLDVTQGTSDMLLNIMVYEQMLDAKDAVVTSYIFLMDDLINTASDVALLREKGIVRGWIGSEENVASLFNTITKGFELPSSKLGANMNKELHDYCNKSWHKWRANFSQTYLANPWVFISLLAAVFLLILTVVQTVCAILPYYQN